MIYLLTGFSGLYGIMLISKLNILLPQMIAVFFKKKVK